MRGLTVLVQISWPSSSQEGGQLPMMLLDQIPSDASSVILLELFILVVTKVQFPDQNHQQNLRTC